MPTARRPAYNVSKTTMPLTSPPMKSLFMLLLIIATTTTILAKTSTGVDGQSSLGLADLLHTETVIIENLRNYVHALGYKISAIKRKTHQIRRIYDVALNDTRQYFENPINTFNLIKRMTHEWVAIRNLAWQDVTGHIVENITEFSEILTFPTEQDLEETVTRLLKFEDVNQRESSQLAMGEFNDIEYGLKMSSSLAIGSKSVGHEEHLVSKMLLQAASEKSSINQQNSKTSVEVLANMANLEYQSGNIKEALRLTEEILQLNPKNRPAIAAQATFKEKLKNKIN